MPITIGSNISSLVAQRRLSEGTSQLSKTYERLSSGQRINRASDDAAGLSISESLKSDRRVFNQGVRNFNDGISYLTIADSAIESLSNIIVRVKELAEQSANGVYSTSQRQAIDKEAQALSKEYFRLSQSSKFNGKSVFDGASGDLRLQGGYGASGGIQSGIGGAIGTGSFDAARTVINAGSTRLSTADFNGDGIQDILTNDTGAFSVLLGSESGNFTRKTTATISGNILAITTGDFNGDGIVDAAGADNSLNFIQVALGNGDGTFKAVRSYAAILPGLEMTAGDFNNDGLTDLVTIGQSTMSVFLASGNGTFSTATTYTTGSINADIITGDFTGDGILDLVTSGYYEGKINLFVGRANGTFSARISYNLGNNPEELATGDFNGDGILDLITADYGGVVVRGLFGTGTGLGASFSHDISVGYTGGSISRISSITVGDFNSDGRDDIAVADVTEHIRITALGNGNGTFGRAAQLDQGLNDGSGFPHLANFAVGDFNGDGAVDLATAIQSDNELHYYKGKTVNGVSRLLPFDLSTMSGARQALPAFDRKLQQLSTQRGTIGAFQSRLQVGINNLQSASENYAAAEGRIRNADISQESADLVRLNILQKAAASVLGQANLQPELALRLLRN